MCYRQSTLPSVKLGGELSLLLAAIAWRTRCYTAQVVFPADESVCQRSRVVTLKHVPNGFMGPHSVCADGRSRQRFSKMVVNKTGVPLFGCEYAHPFNDRGQFVRARHVCCRDSCERLPIIQNMPGLRCQVRSFGRAVNVMIVDCAGISDLPSFHPSWGKRLMMSARSCLRSAAEAVH